MEIKRVCLVGGEDAYKRVAISERLIALGWDVTILGTKHYDYPDPITFHQYRLNRKLNVLSDFKTVLFFRKFFRNRQFDIIQTFDTKPAFLLPLALKGQNQTIVRTVTGLGTLFMNSGIKYRLLRSVYLFLHRTVKNTVAHTSFQNEDDLQYFLDRKLVSKSRSSIILGSGIPLPEERKAAPRRNPTTTFICVARLVYEKGIINYLEAAKMCLDKCYNYRFLLVGPLEEDTNRLNRKILNKYANIVDWLGVRSDVEELMLKSDAFVLPTFREGLSRVILEACSLGLPVITTNVPGTREIVRHLKEGLLIGVNDSNALFEAMTRIGEDQELSDKMASFAFERVNIFSLKQISKEYNQLYRSLL